jgi:hypothetical protein
MIPKLHKLQNFGITEVSYRRPVLGSGMLRHIHDNRYMHNSQGTAGGSVLSSVC